MAYDQYYKNNKGFAKPKRGADINVNVSISLQEAILGIKKELTYDQLQVCDACANI